MELLYATPFRAALRFSVRVVASKGSQRSRLKSLTTQTADGGLTRYEACVTNAHELLALSQAIPRFVKGTADKPVRKLPARFCYARAAPRSAAACLYSVLRLRLL
jgi:hypothetical protein